MLHIIVERSFQAHVLAKVIGKHDWIKYIHGESEGHTCSIARTIMVTIGDPVIPVFDTHTLNSTLIHERRGIISAALNRFCDPFEPLWELAIFKPSIEELFVNPSMMKFWTKASIRPVEQELAKHAPRALMDCWWPGSTDQDHLNRITDEMVLSMKQHSVIDSIIHFVGQHRPII